MPTPSPHSLPENDGLAFVGETPAPALRISARQAKQLLAASNPTGKPNADVLRRVVSADGTEHWQIDFPATLGEREAALYEKPFAHAGHAWRNLHPHAPLRIALARVERYLATPAAGTEANFQWCDGELLPDDTLVAVARDDDFIHGILAARPFALWWREFHSSRTPTLAVSSYPFPWPPSTSLSALTKIQEDQRYALARAARGGDAEALNSALAAAYGWPGEVDDAVVLARLGELNRARGRKTQNSA